ncbi:hypothetical protein GCM10009838_67700 [Catenulispora subtropica]|uniref:TnsA-like heteromeric transposase endonuclease subunit n=1 Tax=Catenulispora subtropica TaxID=450798 RepID=A0ABP5E9E9_9ACTN
MSFAGFRWSAKTGRHVGYESWLERDHAVLLDFDPRVLAFSSQPFRLHWRDALGLRRHVPDYFVRRDDGSAFVLDVREDDRIGERDAELFAATAQACARVGWGYHRLGAVDAVLAANLRWLSAYRHPRFWRDEEARRLLRVFATPAGLFDGADEAGRGNRLGVLPVLFHLMWRGLIAAELSSAVLGPSTSAVVAASGGR